ncbi:uncharacterized mitochondrial protein AtMg00860-like [Arachis hypogaea]|uniref:uncharacterized mitochondrial protein AtMg00860-like n=1 Tax=Arachis hypogaea TaxID=3818 RepID=UPI003B21EE17
MARDCLKKPIQGVDRPRQQGCVFAMTADDAMKSDSLIQVAFVGHVITQGGITVDPSKIEAVIALPLTYLRRKEVPLEWTKECEESFETLKEKLTTASVLVLPDPQEPFEV